MNQKTVGLTLRALIIALALILAASPGLPLLDGVAYAQSAAPTLTAVLAPGGASVSVSWTEVTGADSYELYKQQEGGSWSAAMSMTGTTYSDTNITAGESYFYIVRAVTGGTAGAWSNTPKVTIPGGTSAPTGKPTLTATADGLTAIDLSWSAVSGATSYDLRRWNPDTSAWDSIGNNPTGTAYNDSGLESGTQYWYVIRAVNSGGNGPWSSADGVGYASVTLPTTTDVPVLTLTHTSRTVVDLSWTAVSDDATYTVQRRRTITGGSSAAEGTYGSPLVTGLTDTSHTDNTVAFDVSDASDITYYYQVQAVINGITGTWSNEVQVSIPSSGARPPTPSITAVNAIASNRISISWSASVNAVSYQLQYKVDQGSYSNPIAVSGTSYEHTGLRAATEYTYQVRALNVNGSSDWSAESSATTLAATTGGERLGVPSGLRAVDASVDADPDATPPIPADIPGLKVTWNSVSGATDYVLYIWNEGASPAAWQTVGSESDNSLTDEEVEERTVTVTSADTARDILAGQTYYFVIRATAGTDSSDWSAPVSGTTKATRPVMPTTDVDHDNDANTPDVPTPTDNGMTVTARSESLLWISWSSIPNATSYRLEWRHDRNNAPWNALPNTEATTYAHRGRSAGTTYWYRVRAENSGGVSDWSAGKSGTTWSQALRTPTNVMAEDASDDTNSQIKLTWDEVTGATDGYQIQRWNGTTSMWVPIDTDGDANVDGNDTPTTETEYTDSIGVLADNSGMPFYYVVRAVSGDVRSDWSGIVTGMTKSLIPTGYTQSLHIEPTGMTMVRLTWSELAGAVSYELEFVEGALAVGTPGTTTSNDFENPRIQRTAISLSANAPHHPHTGLKAATRYSYRIRAVLPQDVKGPWGGGQVVTRPAKPELSVGGATATTLELTWDAVEVEGTAQTDNANYNVERRQSGTSTWDAVTLSGTVCDTTTDECTFTDGEGTALEPDTLYFYRIRITDDPGGGALTVTSYWDQASQRTQKASE